MRYIIRSVKYFIYLTALFFIIIGALVLLHFVEADWNAMFRQGTDSLWQIAVIGVVFSLIYPYFGYGRRSVPVFGPLDENTAGICAFMQSRGYVLEKKDATQLVFHKTFLPARIMRLGEDRISVTTGVEGLVLEGPSKDVIRLSAGLRDHFNPDLPTQ